MLQIQDLAYEVYSGVPVFAGAALEILDGDRVALTGANGAGKTTLLRILAGALEPSAGRVARRNGLTVAYLSQEPPERSGVTALEAVLEARPALAVLRRACLEDAGRWAEYAEAGGPAWEARVGRALRALGFAGLEENYEQLSAGQRMRVELARCVLSEAGLLLLDEPTNHLDGAGRRWLEVTLRRSEAACVFVSHDRAFLERMARRVAHLERGSMRVYEMGYEASLRQRELEERQRWSEYETAQKRAQAERSASERRMKLARKVADGGPEASAGARPFYEAKAARVAKTARMLRERALECEEVSKPWEEPEPAELDFGQVPRGAEVLARARGVWKGYGERLLLRDFDWEVRRGSRWVVEGPNGCGKSTLVRLLLGSERPDRGTLELDRRARAGYLAQEGENLPEQKTAVELGMEACGDETRVRTMLGCLRLNAEKATRPLATLSAGERTKAALAALLVSAVNLLVLDEPTNHLELEAREGLLKALGRYPGAVVVVTHDEWFSRALGAERVEAGFSGQDCAYT